MSANAEKCRGGVPFAAEAGKPLLDEPSETAAAAARPTHDVNTDPQHVQPHHPRRMSGVRKSYMAWISAVVLLVAVGKWRYDAYMASVDRGGLQARYNEYLVERWSREGEALLTNASLDPSFTHYGGARIYFRAITRRVPIPGTTPTQFKVKIGMPEVDNDNRWRGDDETEEKWRELRNELRCAHKEGALRFHFVGLLSDGTRFVSSYVTGKEAEWRNLRDCIQCLQKVMSLMCTGDKWEIMCPPEEAYGVLGESKVPPAATTVWRVSVEGVRGKKLRTWKEAGALLAASVAHADGTPLMTRQQLFEKSKKYLTSSKTL